MRRVVSFDPCGLGEQELSRVVRAAPPQVDGGAEPDGVRPAVCGKGRECLVQQARGGVEAPGELCRSGRGHEPR